MKTTILTAALILLVTLTHARTINDTVSNPLPVTEQFKAYIFQTENDIIKFRINNPSLDKVVLKIYDEEHVKIFHRSTKKNKEFGIGCDMTYCESGIYTFVVERNGEKEVTKQFVIVN